jgi:hypothetical protein
MPGRGNWRCARSLVRSHSERPDVQGGLRSRTCLCRRHFSTVRQVLDGGDAKNAIRRAFLHGLKPATALGGRLLELPGDRLLSRQELDALEGRMNPHGVIIPEITA